MYILHIQNFGFIFFLSTEQLIRIETINFIPGPLFSNIFYSTSDHIPSSVSSLNFQGSFGNCFLLYSN